MAAVLTFCFSWEYKLEIQMKSNYFEINQSISKSF